VRTIALHIFEAAGVSRARAETLANCLVEADLMGISSHGVIRIPVYVRRILEGLTEIHAEIGPIREHPATALLDGKNVIGQVAGGQAMTLAIQKAAQCGVGCVGLRGTNHFGTCGHYAAMAAKQNMDWLCVCQYNAAGCSSRRDTQGSWQQSARHRNSGRNARRSATGYGMQCCTGQD